MKLKYTEHPLEFNPITVEITLESFEELMEWKQLLAHTATGIKAERMRKKLSDQYFQDD